MQATAASETAWIRCMEEMNDFDERPSGDFIDGFLAGFATANAALSDGEATTFFYSFDWIGDGEEDCATSALYMAFQAEEGRHALRRRSARRLAPRRARQWRRNGWPAICRRTPAQASSPNSCSCSTRF